MGCFDTYGRVQIKAGSRTMTTYKIGDKVDIYDGIYIGNEGIIVIAKSIFIAEFEKDMIFNKQGRPF